MTWLLPLSLFAAVSAGTPGPNNLMLWASGAEFGFRRAIPHVLGTALGIGAMALAVAAGLGALVTAVPAVAFLMKLGGTVYLLYLAWQVAGAALRPGTVVRPLTFGQAMAFQFVNVKGWIFALGAMTTFRPTDLDVVTGSLAVALTMMAVVIPAAALWGAAGGTIGRVLAAGGRARVVSLVLAVLLAVSVVDVWL